MLYVLLISVILCAFVILVITSYFKYLYLVLLYF